MDCKCGADGRDEHTCPFKTEINDDGSLCNCCEGCTEECAMEI